MSSESQNTLVVGATGMLGSRVALSLAKSGRPTRGIVRETSDSGRLKLLKAAGVTLVQGDLKDPSTLERACEGVDVVVSTATSTMSRAEGDTIAAVDELGQASLVEVAERSGVRRFVFVSFPPVPVDFALQRAKRSVEARLRRSSMEFVVLQPANFMEVWLSPALGFDPLGGKVVVFGSGENATSWVSVDDVSRFVCAAIQQDNVGGRVIPVGGPEGLSPLEVVALFEEVTGRVMETDHVAQAVFEQQLGAGGTPLEEAQAAMALTTARGLTVDSASALELLPGRLKSVRDYAIQMMTRADN